MDCQLFVLSSLEVLYSSAPPPLRGIKACDLLVFVLASVEVLYSSMQTAGVATCYLLRTARKFAPKRTRLEPKWPRTVLRVIRLEWRTTRADINLWEVGVSS